MRLGNFIARTAVRRVVWIVVGAIVYAALSWFAPARAQDQFTACYSNADGGGNPPLCPSRQIAMQQAQRVATAKGTKPPRAPCYFDVRGSAGTAICFYDTDGLAGNTFRAWTTECPDGGTWNDETQSCRRESCDGGAVMMSNGQCSPTPEECDAHNKPGGGFGVQTSKPFHSRCTGGCMLTMTPGTGSCSVINSDTGLQLCNGEFRMTGVCTSDVPDVFIPGANTLEEVKEDKPQVCTPGPGGQTYCVRRNGDHCATSAKGRQICWKPGETGTKTDGPVAQVRNAGEQAIQPKLDLPSGDTLRKSGDSITTTTTTGDGNGGQGTKTTTTTTNYTTIHGTNAGSGNQGRPDDASTDTDDDDDDKGSASGGGDCDTRPIVSDPMLEMVATQAWATRCAVEAGNAVKVSGDVGDCKSAFHVEGDDANAVKLRAMRAEICGENQPEWTKGDAPETPGGQDDGEDVEGATRFGLRVGPSLLDESDLVGGGTCPQMSFSLMGRVIGTQDVPQWCDIVRIMRALILIFGAYTALQILLGRQYG
ncbi:hypothetical protein MNO14_08200 [Luteimonas sp. S4-F44]|uniref:hypothetical protein n=1 Tax=Luteimonas sp. S4-F44 TaxID=2925842 RepID=UPI001F53AEBE|nr:hypothetical protein [Luteimonas sp. S4-F44]UNK44015.1 hypothetical protein MNO14_08200 [Luteimonas sp. S4-F44]